MTVELDVLRHVTSALERAGIAYMVTGSMALAHYATPRMTRDIDIVVSLTEPDAARLQAALGTDYYLDPSAMRQAIQHERLFNLMHMATAVKVDLVVQKSSEYRRVEFERRRRVDFGGVPLWIVSREDLVPSKLDWAQTSTLNDTDDKFAALVAARYAAMTALERMEIASSMFDTARAIVASSLSPGLSRDERRYAIAKRIYGDELPEAALRAHACHPDTRYDL